MSPARACAQTHCGVTPNCSAISSAVSNLSIAPVLPLPSLRHLLDRFRLVGQHGEWLLLYDNAIILFVLDAISG